MFEDFMSEFSVRVKLPGTAGEIEVHSSDVANLRKLIDDVTEKYSGTSYNKKISE